MVKSKKMSKTSIAVIVLAILLVLSMVMGITGAWFTKNAKTGQATTTNLAFGKVGAVEVVATGVKHYAGGQNGAELTGDDARAILPGDKVTAGGVKFTYDAADENADADTVWYLIKDQAGTYYVRNQGGFLFAVANAEAYANAQVVDIETGDPTGDYLGQIQAGEANALEIEAQNLTIKLQTKAADNSDPENPVAAEYKWFCLNGDNDNAAVVTRTGATYDMAMDSWQIGNYAELFALSSLGAQDAYVGDVVYNVAGTNYAIAVMQLHNVDAATAFAVLSAELATISFGA